MRFYKRSFNRYNKRRSFRRNNNSMRRALRRNRRVFSARGGFRF